MKRVVQTGTNEMIREVMLAIASDDLLLLETVAAGRFDWRTAFIREYQPHFAVDEGIADYIFNFFCLKVADQWPGQTAGQVLDSITEIIEPSWKRVPTEAEIDAAWEFESHSSVAGHEFFYKDVPGPQFTVNTDAVRQVAAQGAPSCP